VSLPSERIRLSAQRPAIVRLVQLRLAAADIGPDGPPRTSIEVYPSMGYSDLTSRAPVVSIRAVPNPSDDTAGIRALVGSSSEAVAPGADPFAGCPPGADCVRTVLVAISWARGAETALDWQLTVHRLDFERAYAAPSGAIQIRLLDGIDASGKASTLHLEGVARFAAPAGGGSPAPVPTRIVVTTRIVGDAPAYAAMLPIAGSGRLHLVLDRRAGQQSAYVRLKPGPDYSDPGSLEARSETADGIGNPFLSCALGSQCPVWELTTVTTGDASSPPPQLVRWVLDLDVYSYPDLPVVVEATPNP
jgi:hypothetical protein